jgi:hypothetical protein
MRRFYNEQPMAYELVSYIIHTVNFLGYAQLYDMINLERLVKVLLIDGYVAYERRDGGFIEHDVTTLKCTTNGWEILTTGNPISTRKVKNEDMIYLTYNDVSYTDHISLIEQMMVTGLSKDIHKKYIEVLIDNIPTIFEKFDSNYNRKMKLKRVLK